MNPTISITVVCSPGQLELVHDKIAALQQALHGIGVACSLTTTHPASHSLIDLVDALPDLAACVAGLEVVDHAMVHRPEPEP